MVSGDATRAQTRQVRRPTLLRRKTVGDLIFDILNGLFLIVFCITVLYTFWSMILMSFAGVRDAQRLGFHLWISEWHITAYKFALSKYGSVPVGYFNSVFRTVFGTVLTIAVTLLGAYPLSKKKLPGRNVVTIYILVTMFFGGGLIPTYLLIRSLGLMDSRWALIFPTLAAGYYIIIMRNFLMVIDKAYEESAFLDGANYLQILVKIIIPLSKPVIATIALWTAVGHWNEWFAALIYIKSESKVVLQILLRRLIQATALAGASFGTSAAETFMAAEETEMPSEAVRAAVTVLTIGPIVFVYPFIQKYFIKGIFIGSLKG